MTPTLKIRYKCACMQDEGSFNVRERGRVEAITDYMDFVKERLSIDHRTRNPLCMSTKVEYLKLPIAPDKRIGDA